MKLLVLEDSGDFARVLGGVLRGAGIDVTHCSDGAGVREQLVKSPPDIMLVDADTNGQVGLDILRDIRRNPVGSRIPVILTSAIFFENEEPIQRACAECDVNRFMRRPIQVLDLERVLQEASRQRPLAQIAVERDEPQSSTVSSVVSTPSNWGPGRHGEVPEYGAVVSRTASSPSAARKRRRARPQGPQMRQPSQATDAMLTLRRLRRETAQLEHADPWTILGIPRTKDLDRIETARQRMADRYAQIANRDGYSDDIHDMARAIARKVDEAAAQLSKRVNRALEAAAAPVEPLDEDPDEYAANPEDFVDQLFLKGQAALAAGDVRTAIIHLRQARNEHLDSARNMAWLGWALYQDQDRPAADRRSQAMELLELADQFDPDFMDGQFFLAMVEHDGKLYKRAAARLRRLLKTKSDHLGARRLYERVQTALASVPESETQP